MIKGFIYDTTSKIYTLIYNIVYTQLHTLMYAYKFTIINPNKPDPELCKFISYD